VWIERGNVAQDAAEADGASVPGRHEPRSPGIVAEKLFWRNVLRGLRIELAVGGPCGRTPAGVVQENAEEVRVGLADNLDDIVRPRQRLSAGKGRHDRLADAAPCVQQDSFPLPGGQHASRDSASADVRQCLRCQTAGRFQLGHGKWVGGRRRQHMDGLEAVDRLKAAVYVDAPAADVRSDDPGQLDFGTQEPAEILGRPRVSDARPVFGQNEKGVVRVDIVFVDVGHETLETDGLEVEIPGCGLGDGS